MALPSASLSAPTPVNSSYASYAALKRALHPVAWWRLGESGNDRVAVDQMGTNSPNLVPNPNFEADVSGWIPHETDGTVQQSTAWAAQGAGSLFQSLTFTNSGYQECSLTTIGGTSGVPVTPGLAYSASVVVNLTTLRSGGNNPQLYIRWYNANGTQLSQINQPGTRTTGPQTITLNNQVAPAGAAFASVIVYFDAGSNITGTVAGYFDAVMLVQTASLTGIPYYEGNGGNDGDYLGSFTTNLLTGSGSGWPSFESGVTNMGTDSGTGSSVVQSSAEAFADAYSALVTCGSTLPSSMNLYDTRTTAGVAATAGATYTASVYSRAVTVGRNFSVELQFFNSSGASVGSFTGSGATDTTSGWTRASATATAPASSAWVRLVVNWGGAASGEQHYADAGQITQTPNVVPYCDTTGVKLGQTGALGASGDNGTSVLLAPSGWVGVGYDPAIPDGSDGPFSIECWIKPQALIAAGTASIAAFSSSWPNNGWWFKGGGNANSVTMDLMDGAENQLSATVTPNVWNHVIATFNGTVATIYVNGTQAAQSALAAPGTVPSSGSQLTIGSWILGDEFFDFYAGGMEEFALYNYALSPQQVSDLYNYSVVPDSQRLGDDQILFQGVKLGGADTPFGITKFEGLDKPDVRSGNVNRPQTRGAYVGKNLLGTRKVTLTMDVGPPFGSYDTLAGALGALTAACSTEGNTEFPIWINMPNLPLVAAMARVLKATVPWDVVADLGSLAKDVPIQFEMTDPYLYSAPTASVTVGLGNPSGGFHFPLTFPLGFGGAQNPNQATIVNVGDVECYPVFTFTGPCIDPNVQNISQAGNPLLAFNIQLFTGDQLIVDTDLGSVLYFPSGSSVGIPSLSALAAGSTFFSLPGGATTELTFNSQDTGPVAGTLAIAWASAYDGLLG